MTYLGETDATSNSSKTAKAIISVATLGLELGE
jgi:hypothetical protein